MGSSVDSYESGVLRAQSQLENAKDAKRQAQSNGNYARANNGTPWRCKDGKSFKNVYDYDIHVAQILLKEAKASLAEAKKRAKKK